MSRGASFAHEWIELVERSGLLVSEPVLHQLFPEGPERVDSRRQRTLLAAWERFRIEPGDLGRQSAWLDSVLTGLLSWPEDRLAGGPRLPGTAAVDLPELDQSLRPHGVLLGEGGHFLLGLWRVPVAQAFDRVERLDGAWRATPYDKLRRWLQRSRTPFGLLTNGEAFRLVHAPADLAESWIEFPAGLFFEEKSVLDGFLTLLAADRFFGTAERRLERLAEESQKTQAELTDRLGDQVRSAVERLILALGLADRGAGGRILLGHDPEQIYKAAVYVVMRLVFILYAEEWSLLPHGNIFFDEGYGLGRLLHLLEEEKRTRPDTFEREGDAWPRLLALFRLIFQGSPHPDLTLPAYGGDLFSPRDFPALAIWEHPALHLPNRAVYEILRALTFGQARVGRDRIAQRYSYRNLDVEHIGYLYEGLLDHKASRAGDEPLVKLDNGTEAAFQLSELESRSGDRLIDFLVEQKVARGDRARIEARLAEPPADALKALERVFPAVAERCRPYAGVIQADEVVEPHRLYLTTSASRRFTGTHYTPIQYTRAMVAETLDPLAYVGEHGKLEEPRRLRSPRELLDLKVCDPAMGSGAFLVQVIRYLGEKLADAWQVERERRGEGVPLYLPYAEPARAREDQIPVPEERKDAKLWAYRLVAERCVYGVDKNPLAVEMAKLSIWLVTLDPRKPFSFVNHALKPGDSLLGISSLGQLRSFSLSGEGPQLGLLEERIAQGVQRAVELRQQIGNLSVVTPADVIQKERLLAEADREVQVLWALADLLISTITRSKKSAEQEATRIEFLARISYLLDSSEELETLSRKEGGGQEPFHWPLGFPEVFERENGGFDALVGNPPYMGGQKLTGAFNEPYREYLVRYIAGGARGSADIVAYFFLRSFSLLRASGNFGLLAVNTIAEGDTRQVGLEQILREGGPIYSAHPNEPWPHRSAATVTTSRVHVHKGGWNEPRYLAGRQVPTISAFLTDQEEWSPKRLKANEGIAFQGSIVLGMGFVLTKEAALVMLERDPRNTDVLFPYLNGEDLNSHPEQKPSRWVINFWDWPEERARKYPELFSILQEKVRPERLRNNRKTYRDHWWQFAEKRPALYHAIGRGHLLEQHPEGWQRIPLLSNVICCSEVTKHLAFAFVPNDPIFSANLDVLAADSFSLFAVLQSSIHELWARHHSAKLETRLKYSPGNAFLTFPLPKSFGATAELGKAFSEIRARTCRATGLGLTDFYNHFHDVEERGSAFVDSRELQVTVDRAVVEAYGWNELKLEHGYHVVSSLPENDRVRFTISEQARIKLLDLLARLNRERYEEELAQGLHEDNKPSRPKAGRRSKADSEAAGDQIVPFPLPAQPPLFPVSRQIGLWEVAESGTGPAAARRMIRDAPGLSEEAPPGSNGLSIAAQALHSWLREQTDWRSRSDVLDNTGLTSADWTQAIRELLDAGLVERAGEKRGTRYRAKI